MSGVLPATPTDRLPAYAELHCVSNFSFLRGASHAEELLQRALALGYNGLAITDDCSLAGVVRAHLALRQARQSGQSGADDFKLIMGSELAVADPLHGNFRLVVLACNRLGYGQLSERITRLRRATEGKAASPWLRSDIDGPTLSDCLVLMLPDRSAARQSMDDMALRQASLLDQAQWLQQQFAGRCWLAVELLNEVDDAWWLHELRAVSLASGVPLVASSDVHMHVRSRKPLHDVLTATRLGRPLSACGLQLHRHAEQHLRSRLQLTRRYPADLLAATQTILARCHFSLDELRYEYPDEVVPDGATPASHLRQLAMAGAALRFPQGVPDQVLAQIEHELSLIADLGYEKYFLTVHDIVRFARSKGILCQGRGSAANSAVCYCLGVTEVDPARTSVLFERFISKERNEPPDIDVDFEHERREEVIQYIYARYGRDRTALTATVITYRTRSALRDVGKALGFDMDTIERVAHDQHWWDGKGLSEQRLQAQGLDAQSRRMRLWQELTRTLMGFPRHLSQHTGGFVIARGRLCQMVPIENASMPGRSVIQWDKDDLDALGLLKVDVLALGMLSALRRALDFISQRLGRPFRMQDIPAEDPATYDMLCKADAVGVFQVESRAQMSMLPRLRPRCFYDLVVEVALVRPGPIQGGMVHPYLRRRQDVEANDCPRGLEGALGRTLGVPIFQEQVMQVAIIAAGFTPGEADALRRAMAAWRRKGGVDKFYARVVGGMTARGYPVEFAERIFKQIEGFGSYGFPESHAASFALLVYASAWIKCHEPAAFLAGLLNAQPLGFYSPSQLVQDARRHGVAVLPPDVSHSDWDSSLVAMGNDEPPAVRLGLRLVNGLGREAAHRLVQARLTGGPWLHAEDLSRRAALEQADMRHLAAADALASLAGHRRQQVWAASALHRPPALLRHTVVEEDELRLPEAPEGEEIVFDYAATGLTLRRHPLALLRARLDKARLCSAAQLGLLENGRLARACGIVTVRQQPDTAAGVVFVTLEDETGTVNVIVWKQLRERQRHELLHARLLAVYGVWQREGEVCHLIAQHLKDMTPLLGRLGTRSRDFH